MDVEYIRIEADSKITQNSYYVTFLIKPQEICIDSFIDVAKPYQSISQGLKQAISFELVLAIRELPP